MPVLAIDDDRLVRMARLNGLDAVGIAPVVLSRLMQQAPANELPVAPQAEPISAHPQQEHHVRGRCTH